MSAAVRTKFASRLKPYLPDHRVDTIAAWCQVVRRIGNGGEIDTGSETYIPIRIDQRAIDEHEAEFAECHAALSCVA